MPCVFRLYAKAEIHYLPEVTKVSKVCEVCAKGPSTGYNVSHSNRHTKRRWLPNLQSVRANLGGTVRKVKVCTSCLKAGKVHRAV